MNRATEMFRRPSTNQEKNLQKNPVLNCPINKLQPFNQTRKDNFVLPQNGGQRRQASERRDIWCGAAPSSAPLPEAVMREVLTNVRNSQFVAADWRAPEGSPKISQEKRVHIQREQVSLPESKTLESGEQAKPHRAGVSPAFGVIKQVIERITWVSVRVQPENQNQ